MKPILLFGVVSFSIFSGFSQMDDDDHFLRLSTEDSIKVSQFLQTVHHIELCELGLTCNTDTVFDSKSNQYKVGQRCLLLGALNNDSIDFSKITKRKEVRPKKIIDFILKSLEEQNNGITLCYNPRNAILFYGDKGTIISYLEICFECDHIRWLNNFGIIGFTSEEYDKLESFFVKKGIKTT